MKKGRIRLTAKLLEYVLFPSVYFDSFEPVDIDRDTGAVIIEVSGPLIPETETTDTELQIIVHKTETTFEFIKPK